MIYLKLFLTFLKIGAVSFGGGYGMIPLMREEVLGNGWLTEDGSIVIDACFSSMGISNRIANSPLVTGVAARVMEKVEKDILDLYFKK